MSKSVLLTGTLDAVGQTRLPRILRDAGCTISLLVPPSVALWSSHHVSRRFPGTTNPRQSAQLLRQHLAEHHYDSVIVLDEPLLWTLVEEPETEWLQGWFPLDLTDRGGVWTSFSKVAFAIACADAGVPVPEFEFVENLAAAQQQAERLGYPVVLKVEHGLAGSGVRVAASPSELTEHFDTLSHGSVVLVQRFVDGPVGTTPVLYERGKPICWFSAYAQDNWPTRYAGSSRAHIVHLSEMEEHLARIGSMTAFHGLAGVDWVQDPADGRILLLELNPRVTPMTYLGPLAGVDFATALRGWFEGSATVQRPSASASGRSAPMFPQNLYHAVDHQKLTSIPRVLADAPWDEPRLVAAHLRRCLTHYLPQSVRVLGKRLIGRTPAAG